VAVFPVRRQRPLPPGSPGPAAWRSRRPCVPSAQGIVGLTCPACLFLRPWMPPVIFGRKPEVSPRAAVTFTRKVITPLLSTAAAWHLQQNRRDRSLACPGRNPHDQPPSPANIPRCPRISLTSLALQHSLEGGL
jgi:hypothetical protein